MENLEVDVFLIGSWKDAQNSLIYTFKEDYTGTKVSIDGKLLDEFKWSYNINKKVVIDTDEYHLDIAPKSKNEVFPDTDAIVFNHHENQSRIYLIRHA